MRFLLCLLLSTSLFSQGKIYDCFLFFNELDILEIRLHEMDPYVDYFVLAEAEETFRGNPKPLFFQKNKERFTQYLDKIIHVVIKGHIDTDIPFTREQMQRDRLKDGLTGADDTDIVMLSDVDEIIKGPMIRRMALPILKGKVEHVGAIMNEYQYYLNRFHRQFLGSVVTTFKYLRNASFSDVRALRPITRQIPDAGWHFSSIGGYEKYITKLMSYSLVERDTEEAKKLETFKALIEEGPYVKIDETFPAYIFENEDHFRSIGFIR